MFPDIPQYVCHAHNCMCVGEDLTSLLAVPIFTTTFSARVQSNSRQTRSSSAAFLMTCASSFSCLILLTRRLTAARSLLHTLPPPIQCKCGSATCRRASRGTRLHRDDDADTTQGDVDFPLWARKPAIFCGRRPYAGPGRRRPRRVGRHDRKARSEPA